MLFITLKLQKLNRYIYKWTLQITYMGYLRVGLIVIICWWVLFLITRMIVNILKTRNKNPYESKYYGR
jgi:hypothetical protein